MWIEFDKFGNKIPNQIDYIILDKKHMEKIIKEQSYVYRYKGYYQETIQVDKLKEKFDLPSDHYPLVLTFSFD